MITTLDVGVISLPKESISVAEINYLYDILNNAKCDTLEIYYIDDTMYICSESLETHLCATYIIRLNDKNEQQVVVEDNLENDLDFMDIDLDDLVNEQKVEVGTTNVNRVLIKFTTLTSFLKSLVVDDKYTKAVNIVISEDKVSVSGESFGLNFPKLNSYYELDYYTDMISNLTFEKINVDSVSLIAKAVTSTKRNLIDMFVSLDNDSVYSDNESILMETKSWKLKNSYCFTYQTITALRKLPSSCVVSVAKEVGRLFLKANEIYLSWIMSHDRYSDNIIGQLNVDLMEDIMTLTDKDCKNIRILGAFSERGKANIIELQGIENGLLRISKDENAILCNCACKKGMLLKVDVDSLLKAISLCGSKSPVIKADFSLKDLPIIFIQGELNIVIGVESVEKV